MTIDKDIVALLAFLALVAVLTSSGNGNGGYEGAVAGFDVGREEDA